MKKHCIGLQGIVRVSHTVLNGHSFLNFDGFAPAADWEEFAPATSRGSSAMTYSYTQIAQYLRCPRSYRYRYLDGWKEKDSRATLLFGRCFEQALARLLPAGGQYCRAIQRMGKIPGSAARIFPWRQLGTDVPAGRSAA